MPGSWRTGGSPPDLIAGGKGNAPCPLLPLDCAGGFGGDVVDDAVDAAHLVDEAGRGAPQELVREREVVGCHAVGRGYRAQRADEIVGAAVAHHADAPHRQEDGEGLPDRTVEAAVADL